MKNLFRNGWMVGLMIGEWRIILCGSVVQLGLDSFSQEVFSSTVSV